MVLLFVTLFYPQKTARSSLLAFTATRSVPGSDAHGARRKVEAAGPMEQVMR